LEEEVRQKKIKVDSILDQVTAERKLIDTDKEEITYY